MLLLSAVVMLFAASCGKNGAVGPQGPQGAIGAIGATGPGGPTGPKGNTGTANVIYSDWYTSATYTKDTIFSKYHFYANISASKITQGVLDSGTVVVYGRLDGYTTSIWPAAQISALPILITYQEGTTTYTDTWSSLVTLGNIQIDLVDNKNLYGSISNAHKFRYVIIPGGVHTTASINLKNYEQVKAAFNLKDRDQGSKN